VTVLGRPAGSADLRQTGRLRHADPTIYNDAYGASTTCLLRRACTGTDSTLSDQGGSDVAMDDP